MTLDDYFDEEWNPLHYTGNNLSYAQAELRYKIKFESPHHRSQRSPPSREIRFERVKQKTVTVRPTQGSATRRVLDASTDGTIVANYVGVVGQQPCKKLNGDW